MPQFKCKKKENENRHANRFEIMSMGLVLTCTQIIRRLGTLGTVDIKIALAFIGISGGASRTKPKAVSLVFRWC